MAPAGQTGAGTDRKRRRNKNKMKKQVLCVSLAVSLAAAMGAYGAVPVAETELSYKGNLSICLYTASEDAEDYGGCDTANAVIEEWNEIHPDITIEKNIFTEDEYDQQITALAEENALPDIFLFSGVNTSDWAEKGLILDLTDYIRKSPYNNDYEGTYFIPFRADGKAYGYPALTCSTGTVVIYDKALWQEAGFESFPGTWKEVLTAAEYFNRQGIDTIAFGNADLQQAERSFFSVLGDRYTGSDWFRSLVENNGAAFTDSSFIKALDELQYLFTEEKIFNDDFNVVTNEQAREFYITGNAAAYIGSSSDEVYIWEALKEADPEKFENMGFASLPQPIDASKSPTSQNMTLAYAFAVNPAISEDPDKLEAAVDLVQEATGPAFSSLAAENYALSGLTAPGDADISSFDRITQDFFKWSYIETEKCPTYDTYIDSNIWLTLAEDLKTLLSGELAPEEAAYDVQAVYKPDTLQ